MVGNNKIKLDTLSKESPIQYLELFVNYPSGFLCEFAKQIEQNPELTEKEIIRLIGLYRYDNFLIQFASDFGVHPITGCDWSKMDHERVKERQKYLTNRNDKAMLYLEKKLKELIGEQE